MNDNQDHFNVLRKINSKPKSSQREMALELGFSLGKLNYCLKALKNKGIIKIKNFRKEIIINQIVRDLINLMVTDVINTTNKNLKEICPRKVNDIYKQIDKCQFICLPCHHMLTDVESKFCFTRVKQNLTRKLNNDDMSQEEYLLETVKWDKIYKEKMCDVYLCVRKVRIPN